MLHVKCACNTFGCTYKRYAELFASRLKTTLELINTSARIHELLLAREERMALRANFNAHITLGGSCYDCFAASAFNGAFLIIRMDTLLHCHIPFHKIFISQCIVLYHSILKIAIGFRHFFETNFKKIFIVFLLNFSYIPFQLGKYLFFKP